MNAQPDIRFGTDGWRAIIGDDYTFANVRACAAAVAMDLRATGQTQRGVAVGFDTRFGSRSFAEDAANVIANQGIPVQLSDRPLPTPALSYAVTQMGAAAGVMITASHNPPEWNGFKVKSEAGGSAPPEQVERVEANLPEALAGTGKSDRTISNDIETVDMVSPYLKQLSSMVDLEPIRSAGIRVAVDSMHGSGAGIVAALLEGGSTEISEIRSEINPAFPGMKQPEPVEENLAPLISHINKHGFDVGVATDGDADRLGVVAENGHYVTTLEVFSMLFHHLKSRRQLPGGAACTITMSSMMDRLTEYHKTDCTARQSASNSLARRCTTTLACLAVKRAAVTLSPDTFPNATARLAHSSSSRAWQSPASRPPNCSPKSTKSPDHTPSAASTSSSRLTKENESQQRSAATRPSIWAASRSSERIDAMVCV